MDSLNIIMEEIKNKQADFAPIAVTEKYTDEIHIQLKPDNFKETCLTLHKILGSAIMMLFASDETATLKNFIIRCVFLSIKYKKWVFANIDVPQENAYFDSLAKSIYSAHLFEREIKEMFGIEPRGNPDLRGLHLHEEVWPQGNYPLLKNFKKKETQKYGEYKFSRVQGEGIFEVPVGPVHAGIIGPGHFHFSVAGEPIINLEIRLGFTHRGIEKLFEGKNCREALTLAECVSGDSNFAHSTAFAQGIEKISGTIIPKQAAYLRGIFLELERMYNHVNDIGGIAVDVGYSFPCAYASIIKEAILQLNESLTGSRYLRKVNVVGGVSVGMHQDKKNLLIDSLQKIMRDFKELVQMLNSSVSFMDRVDTTGVLRRKTAEDLGVVGLSARASGLQIDLRKYFFDIYQEAKFNMMTQQTGDVLARLMVRIQEFEESVRLIKEFLNKLALGEKNYSYLQLKEGSALGYAESWRGPVLYWIKTDTSGLVQRCKVVDPSFHNWQGLSFAVLGNIIPDFPLCNKSFDLSYSGSDL